MRRKTMWTALAGYVVAMLLTIALGSAGGCATTPEARYAQVNDTFIAAVQTLNQAKQDGVIDTKTWDSKVLPLINSGNKLLDQYSNAVVTGQPTASIAKQLQQILDALQPYLVKAASGNSGG